MLGMLGVLIGGNRIWANRWMSFACFLPKAENAADGTRRVACYIGRSRVNGYLSGSGPADVSDRGFGCRRCSANGGRRHEVFRVLYGRDPGLIPRRLLLEKLSPKDGK